jgi:hypothetical protein
MPEKFMAITTNRGEIFLLVPSNPKKQYKIQFTKVQIAENLYID